MFELTKHKAYELLKTTWSRVSLDYVILSVGKEYEGYATHKLAVIEAFRILELRFAAFAYQLNIEANNMRARNEVRCDERNISAAVSYDGGNYKLNR